MWRTDMKRRIRVMAPERYSVPYVVNAETDDEAIMMVKNGVWESPDKPTAREKGYEKTMVFEGFIANQDMWETEDVEDSLEEKLDQPRTTRELAEEVISAQDASNFYALTGAFRRAVTSLRKGGLSLREIERHPVTMAWLSKLCSLVGDSQHDVWRGGDLDKLAKPDVEEELDREVQEHNGSA
jgi:hypothetical protein